MMDFEAEALALYYADNSILYPAIARKLEEAHNQGRDSMKKECLALCTWGKTEHGERYPTVRGVAEEIKKL